MLRSPHRTPANIIGNSMPACKGHPCVWVWVLLCFVVCPFLPPPILESQHNLVMKTWPWVSKDLGSICHWVLVRLQASYLIFLVSVPHMLRLFFSSSLPSLSSFCSHWKLWGWPVTFHLPIALYEGHRFHLTIQSLPEQKQKEKA